MSNFYMIDHKQLNHDLAEIFSGWKLKCVTFEAITDNSIIINGKEVFPNEKDEYALPLFDKSVPDDVHPAFIDKLVIGEYFINKDEIKKYKL